MSDYLHRHAIARVVLWMALMGYTHLLRVYVPEPYMDEIFHIPQAKLYCQRIYDRWDPSITTPPGLYFLSSLLSRYSFSDCTTTSGLRIHVSFISFCLLPFSLNRCVRSIHRGVVGVGPHTSPFEAHIARIVTSAGDRPAAQGDWRQADGTAAQQRQLRPPSDLYNSFQTFSYTCAATSVTLGTFPLIVFFGGLYYTDVPGLTVVVASYVFSLRDKHGWAGLLALLSLTFRQTNVIWIAWIMATAILRTVERPGMMDGSFYPTPSAEAAKQDGSEGAQSKSQTRNSQSDTLQGCASREKSKTPPEAKRDEIVMFSQLGGFRDTADCLIRIPRMVLAEPKMVYDVAKWYMPTFLSFAVFLYVNGGIVLGHQEHHVAGLHFPQMMYFVAFATVMGWPALFDGGLRSGLKGILRTGLGGWRQITVSMTVLLLMNIAVYKFTLVHPFLLADNRHYFFYIWRRVFERHWAVRYALTPGYLICGWAWAWKVGQKHSLYWMLSFLAATSLVLVPAPLVEPRYFLIPYIMLRVHTIPERVMDHCTISSARTLLEFTGVDADRILRGGSIPTDLTPATRKLVEELSGIVRPRLRWLYVEMGWYLLINLVTIGLFLRHTFEWEGWEGKMRFMW